VTISPTFTDPGADADWGYEITWGDTQSTSGTTSVRSLSEDHQYLTLGEHEVEVCVTDDHGTTCDTLTVTVVNTVGKVTAGTLKDDTGGRGGFNVQSKDGLTVKGELQFRNASINFHGSELTAIAVSEDGMSAWFGVIGRDGEVFVAYVEDNGEPGTDDVFKLWIGEGALDDRVLQNGDGELTGGNVQIPDGGDDDEELTEEPAAPPASSKSNGKNKNK
jgi:hypothetical protein